MDVDSESDDYEDIEEEEGTSQPKVKKKMGRPPKAFKTNGPQQRRQKLKSTYETVKADAEQKDLDFEEMLGHLYKMHLYSDPKKVPDQNKVALAQCLIDGINPLDKTTMSVEKGVFLNENVIYGETKWQTFKNAMDPLSKITTNHAMRQFRKDFYPKKGTCIKIEKGCK